jgi:hypothetical protein
MSESWLFLDGALGKATGFTVIQMANELRAQGHQAKILKLLQNGQEIDPNNLYKFFQENTPTHIAWDGAAGWRYWEVIKQLVDTKKLNFWFDDPITPIEAWNLTDVIKEASLEVNFFCWDPYYKDQMRLLYGVFCNDIDLAAAPSEYYTTSFAMTDEPIFIGNLHSTAELERTRGSLPRIFQKVLDSAVDRIKGIKDKIPPQGQLIDGVLYQWPEGDRQLWNDISKRNGAHLRNLRWYLWAYSKNEARVRMLKRVLKLSPVWMFTETRQLHHASADEIRSLTGEYSPRLKITDTKDYGYNQLCQLNHYGPLHLEAVDPQSVLSGIPYRVFQTAASGRALFTDARPLWNNSFEYGKEILVYNHENLEEAFLSAMKSDLTEIGKNANFKFLQSHTWTNRMDHIHKLIK